MGIVTTPWRPSGQVVVRVALVLAGLGLARSGSGVASSPAASPACVAVAEVPAPRSQIVKAFGQLPLYFVDNRGQLDPRVVLAVQGTGTCVYFTTQGLTFALTQPAAELMGQI